MARPPARERLAEAAFALFDERGYEQTTVDDITERAGLGRTTFFRHYRAKEEVIFPDHDRLIDLVRRRLLTSGPGSPLAAVCAAVRLVLLHYLGEGELARRRYALTSTVAALRDREIASVARYQRLFREFLDAHGEPDPLRAELMAAAVVAAHNHVLRRWLRAECADPLGEVDEAMRQVTALFAAPARAPTAAPRSSPSGPARTSARCCPRCAALRRARPSRPGRPPGAQRAVSGGLPEEPVADPDALAAGTVTAGSHRGGCPGRLGAMAHGTARPAVSRRREIGQASARSLLMTILGEFVLPRGGPVWTQALVSALSLFGIEQKSARQALARTAAEGWLASQRVGRKVRWSLTPPGQRLLSEGAQRIYSFGRDEVAWDGRWLLLLVSVPESQRDLRHRVRSRLNWAG